jgi:hypothetical protein
LFAVVVTGTTGAKCIIELNVVEDTLLPVSVVYFLVCATAYITIQDVLMGLRWLIERPFQVCKLIWCWMVSGLCRCCHDLCQTVAKLANPFNNGLALLCFGFGVLELL